MVAAFGSGAMFSLVSGVGGPNQVVNAVTSGLFFALVQGGLFQVSFIFLEVLHIEAEILQYVLCHSHILITVLVI